MYNRRRFSELALGSTAIALISGPLQAAVRRAPDLTITAFEWSLLGADAWERQFLAGGECRNLAGVVGHVAVDQELGGMSLLGIVAVPSLRTVTRKTNSNLPSLKD